MNKRRRRVGANSVIVLPSVLRLVDEERVHQRLQERSAEVCALSDLLLVHLADVHKQLQRVHKELPECLNEWRRELRCGGSRRGVGWRESGRACVADVEHRLDEAVKHRREEQRPFVLNVRE